MKTIKKYILIMTSLFFIGLVYAAPKYMYIAQGRFISSYILEDNGVVIPNVPAKVSIPFPYIAGNIKLHPTRPFVYVSASAESASLPYYGAIFMFHIDPLNGSIMPSIPSSIKTFGNGGGGNLTFDPTGNYLWDAVETCGNTQPAPTYLNTFYIDPSTGILTNNGLPVPIYGPSSSYTCWNINRSVTFFYPNN